MEELEGMLDTCIAENYQYMEAERIKVLYKKGKMDWRTCVKRLEELLDLTLDWKNKKEIPVGITAEENSILNQIALISYENGEQERAIQILSEQVEMFRKSRVHPVFHILEWETAMGNLALALEETHQLSASIEISKEKLSISMEAGKGNHIGFTLASMAGIFEQYKDDYCVHYFVWCRDLLKLYKIDKRCLLVEEYINNPDFRYKEEVNCYRYSCLANICN